MKISDIKKDWHLLVKNLIDNSKNEVFTVYEIMDRLKLNICSETIRKYLDLIAKSTVYIRRRYYGNKRSVDLFSKQIGYVNEDK